MANNLPDIDLTYSSNGKLSYLLEHRGYTHTVIGCAGLALLLYVAVAVWLARRKGKGKGQPTLADHLTLVGVALVGTALHLGMDFLNSYGVHPFWPLDNRWLYGDSVFIVEPLYWAAAAPLLFGLETRAARAVLALLLAAAVTACFVSGLVAQPIPVLFTVLVLVLLATGRRLGPRAAAFVSVAFFLMVTMGFIMTGHTAAARVESAVRADFPADRMLDHVLTPMPVNPLCWDVLVLEVHDDRYIARHAAVALAPRLVPAATCGRGFLDRQTFVPQTRLPVSPRSGIEWREFAMLREEFAALATAHCDAAAFLRFARAPFALPAPDGWILGDLRFDRDRSAGFSAVEVARVPDGGVCPWTPPWVPPRADLLGP